MTVTGLDEGAHGENARIGDIKGREPSEAAQEQLGRELLERIDALAELRTQIEIGLRDLDAGLGEDWMSKP